MTLREAVEMSDVIGVGDKFEGKEVISVAVELPNVAGGLRDAMKFGPTVFGQGEDFCLVLKGKCQKVRFDPENKDDYGSDQVRVQILHVEAGTFIDESTVAEALRRQQELIEEGKKREEAEKGIQRLEFGDGASPAPSDAEEENEAFALALQHSQGVHADGRRDGCPVCKTEADAEAAEAAEDANGTIPDDTENGDGTDGDGADGPIPIGKAKRATKKAAQ